MQRIILMFGVIGGLALVARAGEVPPLKQPNVRQAAHIEHDATVRQIIAKLRICEGDPQGSIEKKTLKLLSEPAMTFADFSPAALQIGTEVAVPGAVEELMMHGVKVEIKPRGSVDGKIRADIACEFTQSMKATSDDQVSVGGVCIRTSGLFTPGKMVKLASPGSDTWIEVTLDVVEPKVKSAAKRR